MKLDEFISKIESRPSMYFVDDDISVIEAMIYGYQQAIMSHGLDSDATTFNHDFNDFIHRRNGWSTARGWANTLVDNVPKGTRFVIFLKLYKEFREKNA